MVAVKTVAHQLADAIEIIRKKNTELTEKDALIRHLRRDNDTAEIIRKTIFNLSERSPNPPAWVSGPGGKTGRRGSPCTIWSDWHYGEVVRPEELGGVNEFNPDIAKKRVKKLVSTTIDLSFNHMGRSKQTYPGIIVCLGGDMITGDIHEELLATNDLSSIQSVHEATDITIAALDQMATAFGKVFVVGVVGNHGRTSHKPRMKGRVITNFDWLLYCSVERYFKGNKNIRFYIPAEADAFFTVFGHRYLLTHGDSLGVKGGDGIIGAVGPILRGSLKVHRSEANIGRDFDTLLMGHWHQYISLPGIIVNNSLIGLNEFGHLALRAPAAQPSQALWFTHPEHGITARWEVFLEPKRTATETAPWISWQEHNGRSGIHS